MKVRLLKDHDGRKAGWTIEVPDSVGAKLCKDKIAEQMPNNAPASKSGAALSPIDVPEDKKGQSK